MTLLVVIAAWILIGLIIDGLAHTAESGSILAVLGSGYSPVAEAETILREQR